MKKKSRFQLGKIVSLMLIACAVIFYILKYQKVNTYVSDYFAEKAAWNKISHIKKNTDTTLRLSSDFDLNDTTSIIKILEMDASLASQRLVIALDDEYSLQYLLYRLLPIELRSNKSSHINADRILALNDMYKFGIGGIQIKPNVLLQFNTFKNVNLFLDRLKAQLTKKILVKTPTASYIVTIQPNFFIDWSFEREGINYNIISKYKDFEKSKGAENIIQMHIDGIFGPNIDFFPNLLRAYPEYKTLLDLMNKNNQFCFFKHFCYRVEYRFSRKSGSTDLHYDDVDVTTPSSKLYNEDLKVYDTFLLNKNTINGIMLGHHRLLALDSNSIVSTSSLIHDFVTGRYPQSITISDDLNMKAYSNLYESEDYYKRIKTNYILFSKLNNFKFIMPKYFQNDMMKQLILHKLRRGKISVKKYLN